jgi:outer membrane usher protein
VSPYQGTTFALVEAKGAKGAKVGGYSGVQIDSRGFAAVPYLNPYQMNDVRIDPKGSSSGVEMENTSQKVAPLDGAIVRVKYQTRHGHPVLINVTGADQTLLFGAEVYDESGDVVGYVGQGGQIYARVEHSNGLLKTGQGELVCIISYKLSKNKNTAEIEILNLPCDS